MSTTSTGQSQMLDEMVAAFRRDHPETVGGMDPLSGLSDGAQVRFLVERGYTPMPRPWRMTPPGPGSGFTDVSINHDAYFTEHE